MRARVTGRARKVSEAGSKRVQLILLRVVVAPIDLGVLFGPNVKIWSVRFDLSKLHTIKCIIYSKEKYVSFCEIFCQYWQEHAPLSSYVVGFVEMNAKYCAKFTKLKIPSRLKYNVVAPANRSLSSP